MKRLWTEHNIRLAFYASLWLKAAFAFAEVIAGIAAHFVSQRLLLTSVEWITRDEFAEDPRDIVANYLLHAVQHLSVSSKEFASIYLLVHGVIKLGLIVGLLRTKLWCYPAALIVFGLFAIYQVYRFSFTHSVMLLLATALDLIVIFLTWHEWRYLVKQV